MENSTSLVRELVRWEELQTWKVRNIADSASLARILDEPAARLRAGGLVAFPTETVYGLGANAWDEAAVREIFRAKGRPADNPLIVHLGAPSDLYQVVSEDFVPSRPVQIAMDVFWPGPLTLILPVNQRIAPSVHPQMATVGVRIPAHPVARALIQQAGCPIAGPSANQSGRPSPTTAQAVIEDMEGRIDGVVDGGACQVGLESTVVAIEPHQAIIYRPGGITRAELEDTLQIPVHLDAHLVAPSSELIAPKSPGMKYRHYAPEAAVHVWWGDAPRVEAAMLSFWRNLPEDAQSKVAVMAPEPVIAGFPDKLRYRWVPETGTSYEQALSHGLYEQLREFDRCGVKHILVCGANPATGLGTALMNRLQKASEGRVHQV